MKISRRGAEAQSSESEVQGPKSKVQSRPLLFPLFAPLRLCVIPFLLLSHLSARSLTHERMDAEILVTQGGDLLVTETFRTRFTGSWNGLIRFIPVDYRSPMGFNYRIDLDLQSITDGSGSPLRYESSRENHFRKFKIWVPGAQDAVKTIVIRYRVSRALLFFEDHDELYWNVTGDEGSVPIESAAAQVQLPAGADGIRVTAFTGPYGSREQSARTSVDASRIRVEATRPLGIREGLTVAVAWNPGLVRRPGFFDNLLYFLFDNWLLVLPLLAVAVMYPIWSRRGRDPEVKPISVRYEPPEGLTPAEVGTLVDHSPDMRDIIATLIETAVQGFVHIKEFEEEKWLGLSSDTEYRFSLVKPRSQWSVLRPHQRAVLEGIFGAGKQSVELSDLKNKFYKKLPGIKSRIFEGLIDKHFYAQRPDKVRRRYLMAALVVAVIFFYASKEQLLGLSPLSVLIPGLLTAAVVAIFGWLMPARTLAGTQALEGILGFQEFLQRVESDRYKRMITGPEMFEKYLPYAVALGVDEQWAGAFADIIQQPPQWYSGSHVGSFHTRSFVSDLGRMSTQASTVMASAPRSSGGSGFSGGSSGGGFGGGGSSGF